MAQCPRLRRLARNHWAELSQSGNLHSKCRRPIRRVDGGGLARASKQQARLAVAETTTGVRGNAFDCEQCRPCPAWLPILAFLSSECSDRRDSSVTRFAYSICWEIAS